MGAMRTQAYALCYPDDVETIVNFDGMLMPLEMGTEVLK